MSDKITRFLGDTPSRTLIKLAVISFVVGIIMSALNFTPIEVWYEVRDFFIHVYDLGFEAFGRIGKYFIYGAMVVIPIFILMRVLKFRP
ncbi:MAG: DUF6460 domain-containing protein [Nitratireductor sp.]